MESSLQGNDRPPDPMTAILMTEKERIDPSLTHVHQVIQEGSLFRPNYAYYFMLMFSFVLFAISFSYFFI